MTIQVFLLLAVFLGLTSCTLRGVNPTKTAHYHGSQFHCADGSQSFPMEYVNDDYCDCKDGSDEPGTSACPNGSFYCVNKQFKGQLISSSRVDDGICDCCDGSDEEAGHCANNCRELGAHLAEEAKRIRREQAIGFQQRLAYVTDGKSARSRRDQDIAVLATEEDKLWSDLEERRLYKEEVEKPALEAKDAATATHEKEETEKQAAADERNRLAAEVEYKEIDTNMDGDVTVDELLHYGSSEDSLLPYEEIKLMADSGEIEPATLLDMIQSQIKMKKEERERADAEQKKREQKRAKKPKLKDVVATVPPPVEEEAEEELWGEDGKKIEKKLGELEDDLDPDEYDEVEDNDDDESYSDDLDDPDDPAPVRNTFAYDPETQKLIDVFEEADKIYNEAKSQHDNVKRQLDDLKKLNNIDFGPDEAYFALKGQCFEMHDEKYRYKLCPFDKSDQDGTNIGRWEGWETGSDGVNRYNVMMYTKGNGCWQGPQRSTRVEVLCGSENRILSASEPAKCEYAYVFTTPAACTKVQEEEEIHDEL